jgi:hypothetical protein
MNPWCMMIAELSSRTPQRLRPQPLETIDSSAAAGTFSAYETTSNRLPARYLLAAYSAWASACSTTMAFQRSKL